MKKTNLKKKTTSKLKKEVWEVFSRYIRMRDGLRTTGTTEWGLCVTCGKRYHFKLLQAGHFISGRHNSNLFLEEGVHAQCYNCNINLRGNTLEYRRKIIQLYGTGADEKLEFIAKQTKKFTTWELDELKKYFEGKIKEMEGR